MRFLAAYRLALLVATAPATLFGDLAGVTVAPFAPFREPDIAPPSLETPTPAGLPFALAPAEARVSLVAGEAIDRCIRYLEIGGRLVRVRIPFGQDDERKLPSWRQSFFQGGKAPPDLLWRRIEEALASEDFAAYLEALAPEGPSLVTFDLPTATWSVDKDPMTLEDFRARPYAGTETSVRVLAAGGGARAKDVYNYFYCVAAAGLDCSGFVFGVEDSLASAFGVDLETLLGEARGLPADRVRGYTGLWLFDPANGWTEEVAPEPRHLRPGDIFLFRGHVGEYTHSAVVRSIDRARGVIRYAQSTDWAPQEERGVHESFILFNPLRPDLPLGDASVLWTQRIGPSFPGEADPPWWKDDGERFRAHWKAGPSLVVRLRALREAIGKAEPGFYEIRPPGASSVSAPR